MKLEELTKLAIDAINGPEWSLGYVNLKVIPPKRFRYQNYVLPFGRKGPRARVLGSTMDRLIVLVDARKLLDWIEENQK